MYNQLVLRILCLHYLFRPRFEKPRPQKPPFSKQRAAATADEWRWQAPHRAEWSAAMLTAGNGVWAVQMACRVQWHDDSRQTRPDRSASAHPLALQCCCGSALQCSASRCHRCIRSAALSPCSPLAACSFLVAISVAAGTATTPLQSLGAAPQCAVPSARSSSAAIKSHSHTPLSLAHLVELIGGSNRS